MTSRQLLDTRMATMTVDLSMLGLLAVGVALEVRP